MTTVTDFTSLLSGSTWNANDPHGQGALVTYSFDTVAPAAETAAQQAGFVQLSAAEKTIVRNALAQWSAVSGLIFVETKTHAGDLTFGDYDFAPFNESGYAGFAQYPDGTYKDGSGLTTVSSGLPTGYNISGHVFFNKLYGAGTHVALHEIGHAIGLKHPFDPDPILLDSLDTGLESVMSYKGGGTTLGPMDIQAIQYLYGAKGTPLPSTTVYDPITESVIVTGSGIAEYLRGTNGNDLIDGRGGRDAINAYDGDDRILVGSDAVSVNAGLGNDIVYTGLGYNGPSSISVYIGATQTQVSIYSPDRTVTQSIYNAETIQFANGTYTVATRTFVPIVSAYGFVPDGGALASPANWRLASGAAAAIAPTAFDNATITGAANSQAIDSGDLSVAGLALGGRVNLAGTITAGTIQQNAATLTVASAGRVTADQLVIATGTLIAAGSVIVKSATLGAATLDAARGGSITISSSTTLAGATLVAEPGGVIGIGSTYTATTAGYLAVASNTTLSGWGTLNGTISNGGTILASGGTLRLNAAGSVTYLGNLQVAAGATLSVGAAYLGTVTFNGTGATLVAETGNYFTAIGFAPTDRIVVPGAAKLTLNTGYGNYLSVTSPSTTIAIYLSGDISHNVYSLDANGAVVVNTAASDPLFDAAFYLARNADVARTGIDPYVHYMTYGWKEGRDPSAEFSTSYYLTQNPDVRAAGLNPLQHYALYGWKEGRNPSALFNTTYYLNQNPDVAAAQQNPLAHYRTNGWREGRDPSLGFSTAKYLAANADVRAAGIDPLAHYQGYGKAEGRAAAAATPHPTATQDPAVDAAYYYAQHPDIAAAGIDATTHYHATGWKQGFNPDAWFDTAYYLAQNPDVRAAGLDPLTHFLAYGWKENRDPSLLFSDAKYSAANPDVRAAGLDPLLHFLTYGQAEGRKPLLVGGTATADPLVDAAYYDKQLGATLIPPGTAGAQQAAASYASTGWQTGLNPDAWFDTKYYLAHNPDVAAAHVNPLQHYETYGWREHRDPSAIFSTDKYLAAYADVRAAGVNPLLHFVQYGQAENRKAFTA